MRFLPRMEIFHTSETQTGQIYLPGVNTVLLFGVMVLVFIFGSSEALATAYGRRTAGCASMRSATTSIACWSGSASWRPRTCRWR